MSFILQPWQLFFVILAGWVNREQPQVIDYFADRKPGRQGMHDA